VSHDPNRTDCRGPLWTRKIKIDHVSLAILIEAAGYRFVGSGGLPKRVE
jgi:hypothetical protein